MVEAKVTIELLPKCQSVVLALLHDVSTSQSKVSWTDHCNVG